MEIDVRHLLRFATKIEKQLKKETDTRAIESLSADLEKIKAEIGKRVLDIPREKPLEPIFERKPSKKKAHSEFVLTEPGSPVSLQKRPQARSMLADPETSAQDPLGLEMKRRVEGWRRTVADALGCQVVEISALKGEGGMDAALLAVQAAKARQEAARFSDTILFRLKRLMP